MGAVLAFGLIVLTPLQGCKSPAPSQAVSAKTASAKDTAELNRLHKAGEMAYHQSDYPAALQYWERGLALAKAVQNNKLPKLALNSRMYFIVPIAMELVPFDVNLRKLCIAHLATFFVLVSIQPRMNFESLLSAG